MASMNNWLGFSLSPQELEDHDPQSSVPHLGFNSDEISTTQNISGESCFDLPSDSPIPSLNHPAPPFGILEAFNRNPHSQDWNMNDVNMSTFSCSSQNLEDENRPKLENFLGAHQEQKSNDLYQLNMYQEAAEAAASHSHTGNNIITNWLRNNPAPPHAVENTHEAPPEKKSLLVP